MNTTVQLVPLECSDREQFISDNQESFNYGAMEEFGLRDNHFEEEGQIISRDTIEQSIDRSEEHTSELQSLFAITYAVFCLKKVRALALGCS